jgi:glycosyltransferase involved in cell wall biosynthesis
MTGLPISVVILAQNSAKTLARALDSVRAFDEVVVVDGGSVDATANIAKAYPNVVYRENAFRGFSEQRNFAVLQASHLWCLVLDSDEAATPELVAGLASGTWDDGGKPLYFVMRTDYFMGRPLGQGYARNYTHPRFFLRTRVHYRGHIHENPHVDGRKPLRESDWVGSLPAEWRILHNPDNDVEDELARIGRYSILRARERLDAGRTITAAGILRAFVRDAATVYREEWRNGPRGFIRTLLVCCHRGLANAMVYAERVRRER